MFTIKQSWMWVRIIVGAVVGVALCVGLILRLDVRAEDWSRLIDGLSWLWVVVIFLLTIGLWWSGSYKWSLWARALHGDAGAEPTPGFFLRHIAWQNWLGQFVPPSLAIILGRSWAARHMPGMNWRAGAGNAFYDQLMEFVLLSSLLPAAWLILQYHMSAKIWAPVALAGMMSASGLIWLFRKWLPSRLVPFLPVLLWWSAVRVLMVTVRLVAGAPALGLVIDPVSIAAAAPVVALVMVLPLTPGNLGIAEWSWVGVLVYGGVNAVDVGLMAVGFRVLIIVVQSLLLAVIDGLYRVRQ